jgi:hypothetical protein
MAEYKSFSFDAASSSAEMTFGLRRVAVGAPACDAPPGAPEAHPATLRAATSISEAQRKFLRQLAGRSAGRIKEFGSIIETRMRDSLQVCVPAGDPISQRTSARRNTSPWDIEAGRATVAGMRLMIAPGSSRVLEKDPLMPVTDAKKKGSNRSGLIVCLAPNAGPASQPVGIPHAITGASEMPGREPCRRFRLTYGGEVGMRGMRLVVGLFAMTAAAATMSACSHADEAAGDVSPSNAIFVKVANNNFLDMDVYAVTNGVQTRLGMVTGNGTGSFVIDRSLGGQDVRIVATPIGGAGRATTGALSVSPGQTIDFRIGPVLSNSTVIIR